jgi:hypothetical protein
LLLRATQTANSRKAKKRKASNSIERFGKKIILFLEMLKFSKNCFSQRKNNGCFSTTDVSKVSSAL